MTINARIESALSGVNCPVGFQQLPEDFFTSLPRITYFCTLENPEYWVDDTEAARVYYVQVDVWHNGDYSTLVASVQSAMQLAGFGRGSAQDIYEAESRIYHKLMRFTYTEVL